MEKFIGEPTPLSPREFIKMRNDSWLANNEIWTNYVTGDAFRHRSFEMINRLLAHERALCQGKTMRIADFGCGEGSLLKLIAAGFHEAELIGIDNCESLLGRIA